ncbi:hypothetical protein [Puia dinghuensis]|uniref:Glycosyltransferase RgtA/B/C/D-like domain-containing protein n=1 Tax=Puia dinghuensis TaxID=1792502 RepID=A0A8J2UF52_9BACT|nr:hypothetical protein [Puia dinghuensis]GGB06991.1 hypothetical protein GCM10011511_33090 [Puia dinghuensis]
MKPGRYTFPLLAAASVLLSLCYCPPFDVGISDKDIFTYAGWAVSKGLIPYKDFVDHKPPLIYFVHALGIMLGGPWALWVINAGLALLATFLLFNCCRRYKCPFPWLPPLLFNLMLRDDLISEGINMTREYTAFFYIFFFCVMMSQVRYRYFLLGLLSGLIFFMQQDQVLPLIPLFLYSFFTIDRVPVAKRLLYAIAGFSTIVAPPMLYFAAHHALGDFWQQAFLFNLKTYTTQEKSFGDHFRSIKRVLDDGNYEIPFMVSLILGITALIWQAQKKGLILATLAAMLLTMSPEFLGGRFNGHEKVMDYIYYFLPLSASISVLLFTVFAFGDRYIVDHQKARLPLVILLCTSLTYTAFQHGTHLPRRDKDVYVNTPERDYLRQHRPGNYQLFICQNEDLIGCYYEFSIFSPTRWIYQHFWAWYDTWDEDGRILRSIGDDLLAHHTMYIIMDQAKVATFRHQRDYDWWMSFMQAHYRQMDLPGRPHSQLWIWKDTN